MKKKEEFRAKYEDKYTAELRELQNAIGSSTTEEFIGMLENYFLL